MKVIDFKDAKCRHCYKCVRYCEVKAISVQNEQAHIMNMLTGAAVCIFVLVLGIRMIGRGMRKK